MDAVAVFNRSNFSLLHSAKRSQIAGGGTGAAPRPLSFFLCGGCLRTQKQGLAFDRKALPHRNPLSDRCKSLSRLQKIDGGLRIQATAVVSRQTGGGTIELPEPMNSLLQYGKVESVHNKEGLDKVLKDAKDHLVVVEYGTSESVSVQQLHPALVTLAATCPDVKFALVLGDESDEAEALMDEANVKTVPHFVFYRNGVKIHEEATIDPETLTGDVLYYGDTSSKVVDIHSQADLDKLLDGAGDKLVVLDMGLTFCGPCVKVYPTVVKLARKMAGFAIFARVMGDENDWCQDLLHRNNVLEVPTFVFLKDGKQQARYVGSARGSLIGEILKLQGVCQ